MAEPTFQVEQKRLIRVETIKHNNRCLKCFRVEFSFRCVGMYVVLGVCRVKTIRQHNKQRATSLYLKSLETEGARDGARAQAGMLFLI